MGGLTEALQRMERSLRESLEGTIDARMEAVVSYLASTQPKPWQTSQLESAVTAAPHAFVDRDRAHLPETTATQVQTTSSTAEWTTVTSRKKGKKKPTPTAQKATVAVNPAPHKSAPKSKAKAKATAKAKTKLPSTPRSAAVLITLRPEAVAEGVTYKDALLKAREHLVTEDLGDEPWSLRTTAAGSRIIQIPGNQAEATERSTSRSLLPLRKFWWMRNVYSLDEIRPASGSWRLDL